MNPVPWRERLAQLPAREPFTTGMASEVGLSREALSKLTFGGALRRPLESVYVEADTPDSLELRCRMLALVLPDDCFVCDRTAAWLHAGDRALAPNEHLSIPAISCFRPSASGRLRNALADSGEREIRAGDLTTVNGIPVTTPLRTAVDLGRLQKTRDLRLHGMDTMLHLGQFTHQRLLTQVPRFNRRRGVVLLRVLAPLADAGAASFGESALRLRWYDAGLPPPRTQIPIEIEGRVHYYLDLGLEDLRFAAEYDGEEWHGPDRQIHDDERRDWLRRQGWVIVALRRSQVFGQQQDAERILRDGYAAALARRPGAVSADMSPTRRSVR
ncbi:hypothetical protein ABLE68_16115 [Nocardioides sp. CN2-186]|uniref:hypothetical protein n=1 Tax=Nocardioides tweenelious TaxID=3156607 RepID=UPI0032B455D1